MVKNWRKARQGNNYVKGSFVLNIQTKYKVNKVVGYMVKLYDFSKFVSIPQGKLLKTFKNKSNAVKFRKKYMENQII